MNSVIIDIGLLQLILSSKYKTIYVYLITWFHEQRDYRYWTITIYFEFKVENNLRGSMNSVIIEDYYDIF